MLPVTATASGNNVGMETGEIRAGPLMVSRCSGWSSLPGATALFSGILRRMLTPVVFIVRHYSSHFMLDDGILR